MKPEQLTGFELQEMRKCLGRPWAQAMSQEDEMGIYAYVYIADKRAREKGSPPVTWEATMLREFGEVMEHFVELTTDDDDDVDPLPKERSGPI